MINVAIVGVGSISVSHIQGYARFPERCRLVALCGRPSKVRERMHELGLEDVEILSSHEDLLGRDDVDLVSVCTPPSTHAPITVDLLDAGLNVVLEKPMAPSLADCDRILEAQRRSGRLLSVIAQNRFRDDIATLKEVVDSGLIGPIAHVRVDSAWWRGLPYYDRAWRGTWASEGGGPTLNHAIHHIDLLLWLMGAPTAVTAMMTNAWHDNAEVEDLSVALLQYDRALAQLTSSVVHHGEEQRIVVQGRDASVSQPWAVHAERSLPDGFPAAGGNVRLLEQLEAVASSQQALAHEGHAGQLDNVLTALEGGTAPLVTGEDGRHAVEVVTAIYQSAIERRSISLPIPPGSVHYSGEALRANAPAVDPPDP